MSTKIKSGWYDYSRMIWIDDSGNTEYINNDPDAQVVSWVDIATTDTTSITSYSNPVSILLPDYPQPSNTPYIKGGYNTTSVLTASPTTWQQAVSISGVWVKNGVEQLPYYIANTFNNNIFYQLDDIITTPITISNFQENDIIMWKEYAKSIDNNLEIISNTTNEHFISNKIATLTAVMTQSIDSRLSGKDASVSMPIFSNTTNNWNSNVFIRNPNLWCVDLSAKLTGTACWKQDWLQSIGVTAITRRHCITAGHPSGPEVGKKIRFANVGGLSSGGREEIFETTLIQRINDINTNGIDISVYLLADELPSWVYVTPIAQLPTALIDRLTNPVDNWLYDGLPLPTMIISQGNWSSGPPLANTLSGSVAYVSSTAHNLYPRTTLRDPFFHQVAVGDSGTAEYMILGNNIFLYRIILYTGGGGIFPGSYQTVINSYIHRADIAAGINTGLSATFINPLNYI
jgi:hypothetical protein